jgi:site-specific DNA-adenine methylase
MNNQMTMFGLGEMSIEPSIINVSSVPQRSPFRYPGGKTWLIPTVRQWLKQENKTINTLVEPFAGGGIVSLTAAFEKLAEKIIMVELDEEIAAVWEVIFKGKNKWLADKIYSFESMEQNIGNENAYFFIDPPYTIAGKRLYTYYDIDHERLFELTSNIKGKFMLTYDDTTEIRQLADKYKLQYRTIPMKTTLHYKKNELIISDNFQWW